MDEFDPESYRRRERTKSKKESTNAGKTDSTHTDNFASKNGSKSNKQIIKKISPLIINTNW